MIFWQKCNIDQLEPTEGDFPVQTVGESPGENTSTIPATMGHGEAAVSDYCSDTPTSMYRHNGDPEHHHPFEEDMRDEVVKPILSTRQSVSKSPLAEIDPQKQTSSSMQTPRRQHSVAEGSENNISPIEARLQEVAKADSKFALEDVGPTSPKLPISNSSARTPLRQSSVSNVLKQQSQGQLELITGHTSAAISKSNSIAEFKQQQKSISNLIETSLGSRRHSFQELLQAELKQKSAPMSKTNSTTALQTKSPERERSPHNELKQQNPSTRSISISRHPSSIQIPPETSPSSSGESMVLKQDHYNGTEGGISESVWREMLPEQEETKAIDVQNLGKSVQPPSTSEQVLNINPTPIPSESETTVFLDDKMSIHSQRRTLKTSDSMSSMVQRERAAESLVYERFRRARPEMFGFGSPKRRVVEVKKVEATPKHIHRADERDVGKGSNIPFCFSCS
jgi:hypothetical protein